MPPSSSRRASDQRSTNRATSVPVGQRETSKLESLRPKKQKRSVLDVVTSDDRPATRGCKRDASSCAASKVDCVASTSALTDPTEQHPRKRPKRAASTPPAPSLSQPSIQLQSRKRSRSRVGSPSADVKYVAPSRVSARLSRKIHPFFASLNPDIYRHLADPDGTGKLLSEPSAGSVISSTPSETVDSQSAKRPRGRRRRNTDLTDENAKKVLMEEWAQMRLSQGTLPLSGSQTPPHESQTGDRSISSMQLKATTQRNTTDIDLAKSKTKTIAISPQETMLSTSNQTISLTQMNHALPVDLGVQGKKPDHQDSEFPSDSGTEHLIVPSLNVATPSTSIFSSHLDEGLLTENPASIPGLAQRDLLQCIESSVRLPCVPSPRQDSVLIRHEKSTMLPRDGPPKNGHSDAPHTSDAGGVHLDTDEEFYMLDVPDVFTLPWVSVSPHLYVPPSLAGLISGMREQLAMEARARRRAEELYNVELSRRMSAEKTTQDLRACLEGKQKVPSGESTC